MHASGAPFTDTRYSNYTPFAQDKFDQLRIQKPKNATPVGQMTGECDPN